MSVSTVNTSQFNAFCQQISILSAQPYVKVVKSEVTAVLNMTIKNTPALVKAKVDNHFGFAFYTSQPASLYAPTSREGIRWRYEKAKKTKKGFLKYNLIEKRYPDALWTAIKQRREAHYHRILAAKGLAKASWVKIAAAIGIKVERPAYVDAAVAVTGRTYDDTSVSQSTNSSSVQILITNSQPTVNVPQVGGERALNRAITGRIKYFERNANHAVFADVAKIAAAYPGLKIAVPAAAT